MPAAASAGPGPNCFGTKNGPRGKQIRSLFVAPRGPPGHADSRRDGRVVRREDGESQRRRGTTSFTCWHPSPAGLPTAKKTLLYLSDIEFDVDDGDGGHEDPQRPFTFVNVVNARRYNVPEVHPSTCLRSCRRCLRGKPPPCGNSGNTTSSSFLGVTGGFVDGSRPRRCHPATIRNAHRVRRACPCGRRRVHR